MYKVIFCRGFDLKDRVVLKDNIPSIEEAKKIRKVGGDIIVDGNDDIVLGDEWLWDWEKCFPNCYAKEMQRIWGVRYRDVQPDDCVMSVEEFRHDVDCYNLTDHDGHASMIKDGKVVGNKPILPSMVNEIPDDVKEIVWFNK